MKYLLTISFFLSVTLTKSQTLTSIWGKSAHSSPYGWGEGWCVASDKLENLYYAGFYLDTISLGPYTLMSDPSSSMFLAKYDSSGNVLWAKSSHGAYGIINGVTTDKFNNCFITGRYYYSPVWFDSDTLTNAGFDDVFLVKYNSTGTILWAKGFGGTNEDYGNSVVIDNFGNAYVTGWFASPSITIGTYTLNNTGGTNLFLAKYDSSGNVIWAKATTGNAGNLAEGITCDNFGNIFITGEIGAGTSNFDSHSITTLKNNFFLAKYSSLGNAIWARSSTGIGDASGYSIATDSIGNIYSTGYFDSLSISFGTQNLINTTKGNLFIVKYDSSGNAVWARTTNGSNTTLSYCIVTDAKGNSYITGKPYSDIVPVSFDTITLQTTGTIDPMFVVKYDSCGNPISGKILASGGDDNNAVTIGPSGNLYIVGDFVANPFIFANDTLIPMGYEDAFIAKLHNSVSAPLCSTTGLNSFQVAQTISVYPNPTSDQFFIETNTADKLTMDLYDVNGRHVFSKNVNNKSNINVTSLSEGIYTLTIKTADRVTNKKLVILR